MPLRILILFILGVGIPVQAQDNFLWGVANAAFQVEGAVIDGVPTKSDWYEWTHTPGKITDGTNADQATDFWNMYEKDFKLASELGVNSFRLSVAWERIQPKENQWDEEALSHYQKIIEKMREYGLEPIVTLHHFVLPKWVVDKGGLLSPDFPRIFAIYAQHVVAALTKKPYSVHFWITFNEPAVLAMKGYVSGEWPPGLKGDTQKALKAQSQMAEAHIQAQREIKKLSIPDLKLGIAQHWRDFQPKTNSFFDRKVRSFLDLAFNRYFINILMTGNPCSKFFRVFCPSSSLRVHEKVLDFIGINYYGRTIVSFVGLPGLYKTEEGPGPKSDMGWEVYPEGMYTVLKEVSKFGLPIMVTENGVADHGIKKPDGRVFDPTREKFLRDHIDYMFKARDEGVNVIGYMYWSLTDNFEWSSGTTPRFGLVEFDYGTQSRKPRDSFDIYKSIIRSH